VRVGLSWPGLSKALARQVADPSRRAVLYLGSAKVADLDTGRDIVAINRKGEVEDNQRAILKDIEGIVLLDGTWSQAKTLWWRNDRAGLLRSGRPGLTIQVEDSACGGECGAPTSVDCFAAQVAWPRPTRKQ
jgi:hypothetical protein